MNSYKILYQPCNCSGLFSEAVHHFVFFIVSTPTFSSVDLNPHDPERVQRFLLNFPRKILPADLYCDLRESTSADLILRPLVYNPASGFYFLRCQCVDVTAMTVISEPTMNNITFRLLHHYFSTDNYKS